VTGLRRWLFAGAGVAALAVLLLGALIAGAPGSPPPTAAAPTEVASATVSPSPAASPSPVTPGATIRQRVWFARDQLPPVAAEVDTTFKGPQTPESRIAARLDALATARAPIGTTNTLAALHSGTTLREVRVDGDLAMVDYVVPTGWGPFGTAGDLALLQQLIYTASEEPGIRRVLITQNGGKPMSTGHVLIDSPRIREDVFGYEKRGVLGLREFVGEIDPVDLAVSHTVDHAAALGRVVIGFSGLPGGHYPRFQVDVRPTSDPTSGAKYELDVRFPGGFARGAVSRIDVETSPIRHIVAKVPSLANAPVNGFVIGVDDLRPWRAAVLFDPARVVIDIGGPPYGASEDDATVVYAPRRAAEVDRTFRVRGVVRAFEATFAWRVRDTREAIVASGFGKANIGTSPVWGGYEFEVSLPSTVTGNITLELFQGSPRDGTEVSKVRIPLFVR
jgi:hypothetical protein